APRAAAQTLSDVQEVAAWVARYRQIVVALVGPLQSVPTPPEMTFNREQRLAWASGARAWANNARAVFAQARVDLAALPPPPPSADQVSGAVVASVVASRPRIDECLRQADEIAQSLLQISDAVEHDQMDRVPALRVSLIEAAMVTMRLFQDVNEGQAAAMSSD